MHSIYKVSGPRLAAATPSTYCYFPVLRSIQGPGYQSRWYGEGGRGRTSGTRGRDLGSGSQRGSGAVRGGRGPGWQVRWVRAGYGQEKLFPMVGYFLVYRKFYGGSVGKERDGTSDTFQHTQYMKQSKQWT